MINHNWGARSLTVAGILCGFLSILAPHAWANNPVPLINQPLSPASTPAGGASFTLIVNGSGFVKGSTIYWNNSARKTSYLSSTQLKTYISASEIAISTTGSVTVVNPAPGGGTSNVVFFQVTSATVQVSLAALSGAVSSNPLSVATGDFNSDGKQDLAVANNASNTVSILLGNGDGTFQTHVDYATGTGPSDVIVADFNRDGKLDLAVVNEVANTISVLLGNGNGTFAAHVDYATGLLPFQAATGDFNQDGNLDLAVVNQQTNTISVLLGNGDGTFQPQVTYSVGSGPMSIIAGDFNGDSKIDLAVANSVNDDVAILIGNGDGTFQSAVDYQAAVDPVAVVAADFNQDGKLDLAVAGLVTSSVAILLGNGDGTFQPPVSYTTGSYPESVAVGDFNGDGIMDLALATDTALGSVSMLLGNGDGTFQNVVNFAAGLLPVAISTGDFNGDGKLDVAVTNFNSSSASAMLETSLAYTPGNLTFASQTLGTTSAAQTVTLTNVGNSSISVSSIATAAPYAETNTCGGSVGVGSSCSVNVTFSPTLPGTSSGTLTLTDGAVGSPQVVSLSGTGTGPVVSLSPTSLNFGNVNVGSTSPRQTVTLTNTGNATLNITSVTISGAYKVQNNCGATLAANKSCSMYVNFTPTTTGMATGTLTVTDNALGSPHTVSLTGVGVAPSVQLSPTSLSFGDQVINTTSPPQTVTLTNTGTASLTINSVTIGSVWAQTNNCGSSVAAGASCTFQVTFTPIATGSRTGNLNIFDNATGSPQKVSLSGTGTAMKLVPGSLNFGSVKVGQKSGSKNINLTNVGTTKVNITSITITGAQSADFSQTNTCGKSIAGGATCSITVTFTPGATGTRTASVSVSDYGGGSPQTASLTGTGS